MGNIDCEAIDCLLGADDGTTAKIIEAMEVRGLIVAGRVSSWEKRQPKREREDDRSSDRVKALRAKQREATPCNATKRQETPCNATKRQETPREEKSREEVNHSEANASAGEPAKVTDPDEIIFGGGNNWLKLICLFCRVVVADWCALRLLRPVVPTPEQKRELVAP